MKMFGVHIGIHSTNNCYYNIIINLELPYSKLDNTTKSIIDEWLLSNIQNIDHYSIMIKEKVNMKEF